jgi:hypothetical protein
MNQFQHERLHCPVFESALSVARVFADVLKHTIGVTGNVCRSTPQLQESIHMAFKLVHFSPLLCNDQFCRYSEGMARQGFLRG